MRTTTDVIESHLHLRKIGDLERDLAENYDDEVVLLSWGEGVHRGPDGVRHLATVLNTYLPEGNYEYHDVLIEGSYGMLRWTGTARSATVHDGADSYVVQHGRIVAQSIYYAVSYPENRATVRT
ncbi:nuclear transport factor 2 family protein [Demequina sp. SO4-13]|uniref:nuclear transport factor 2 family protein n=1 Tax=Demequina sp. SO4-13 TaxID=3401027 RepID=UPI003AF72466